MRGLRDTDLYHLDVKTIAENLRPMTRAQFTQHEYRKQAKKYMVGIDQYDLDGTSYRHSTIVEWRSWRSVMQKMTHRWEYTFVTRAALTKDWRTRPQLDFGVTIRYQITSLSYKHT
jgi:uncharacterized short protein YbdD (DUF466 family)